MGLESSGPVVHKLGIGEYITGSKHHLTVLLMAPFFCLLEVESETFVVMGCTVFVLLSVYTTYLGNFPRCQSVTNVESAQRYGSLIK